MCVCACVSVCLCVCLSVVVVSQHNRRIATKFGMHMRIDLGGILRGKNFKSGKCHELPRTSIIFVIPHLTPPVRGGGGFKTGHRSTLHSCIFSFWHCASIYVRLSALLRSDVKSTCACLRLREQCLRSKRNVSCSCSACSTPVFCRW